MKSKLCTYIFIANLLFSPSARAITTLVADTDARNKLEDVKTEMRDIRRDMKAMSENSTQIKENMQLVLEKMSVVEESLTFSEIEYDKYQFGLIDKLSSALVADPFGKKLSIYGASNKEQEQRSLHRIISREMQDFSDALKTEETKLEFFKNLDRKILLITTSYIKISERVNRKIEDITETEALSGIKETQDLSNFVAIQQLFELQMGNKLRAYDLLQQVIRRTTVGG